MRIGELIAVARECKGWTLRDLESVTAIEAFLLVHGYERIDRRAMQKQIRPRSPACYPGMMEFELLNSPMIERARSQPGRPGAAL